MLPQKSAAIATRNFGSKAPFARNDTSIPERNPRIPQSMFFQKCLAVRNLSCLVNRCVKVSGQSHSAAFRRNGSG